MTKSTEYSCRPGFCFQDPHGPSRPSITQGDLLSSGLQRQQAQTDMLAKHPYARKGAGRGRKRRKRRKKRRKKTAQEKLIVRLWPWAVNWTVGKTTTKGDPHNQRSLNGNDNGSKSCISIDSKTRLLNEEEWKAISFANAMLSLSHTPRKGLNKDFKACWHFPGVWPFSDCGARGPAICSASSVLGKPSIKGFQHTAFPQQPLSNRIIYGLLRNLVFTKQ